MEPLKTGQRPPWRRRNFFIKKEFQARFAAKFLGVIMVGSAMSGYIMYLLVNRDMEDTFYTTHIKVASTGELLLPTLLKVNLGVLALVLVAVVFITLVISRRITGPLQRIGNDTERIARRDFTGDFQLRGDDELKSLAKSFADMNEELKDRFNELREQAEEIERVAQGLLSHQAEDGQPRTGEGEQTVNEHIDRLSDNSIVFGKKLSRFGTNKKTAFL